MAKTFAHLYALICSCLFIVVPVAVHAQVDADVTEKTSILYNNLSLIRNSNYVLFGQEFFNSFRFNSGSAHGDETYSDSKAVTGGHPAVLGSDFHYYLEKNATERGYHTDAVKWAYQQGYAITFDWHLSARTTTSYSCTGSPAGLAKNIANGNANGDRDWYLGELDKVIEIINEDLVVGSDTIPIVFRPLHEMNGNWFWWGTCSGLTAAEYKLLYQLTVDYVKERTKSVLFCWSPNAPFSDDRYPGDEYVDIVGVDLYEATTTSLRTELGKVVDFAEQHNKIAVFSESGDRNAEANSPLYWKDVVLPGILNDPSGKSKKIAWVLTWINASWSEPYVAHTSSSSTVKQSFIDFKNSEHIMFGDEIQNLYEPLPVVVAVEDEWSELQEDIIIYPQPAYHNVTVDLGSFSKPVRITIFDVAGKIVYDKEVTESKLTLADDTFRHTGIYVIKATDVRRTINRKLILK